MAIPRSLLFHLSFDVNDDSNDKNRVKNWRKLVVRMLRCCDELERLKSHLWC